MYQSHQPAWKGILVLLSSVVAASLIAVQPFARSVAAQAELPTSTPTDSATVTPDATWTATSVPAAVLILSTAAVDPTAMPLPELAASTATSTATAVLNVTLALEPAGTATATALPKELVLRPDSADATATRTPTPINVGNLIWDDLDQDGRQDAGEPGLAGVTVQLWNSTKTALISQASTNVSGIYSLIAPTPGNYRVRVVLPSINDQFSPKDQAGGVDTEDSDINPTGINLGFTDVYVFGSNLISITSIDAGIIKFRTPTPTRTPTPINIGNFVWNDLNANGIQDPGEPGVAGVTVQLWNSAKSQILDTDVTDANGAYAVVAPLPGNYRLRVVLPWAGADFTTKNSGADDSKDSDFNVGGADWGFTDIFNLANNVISTTIYDAGLLDPIAPTPTATVGPFNIGNYVWHDLNGDGGQGRGEPGLYKIRVQLWNSTKTLLLDSTLTDTSGQYYLNAPGPGSYRVRVLLPGSQPGAGFTVVNADCDPDFFPIGNDDLCDSDIYPSGGDFGYSRIYTFTASSNVTLIDAGLINIVAIPTPTRTPTPPPTDTATSTPELTSTPPVPGTPVPQFDTYLPLVVKE
jgi:SdrD B-like domain